MNKDKLFIATLSELKRRIAEQDEYEVLMIAGLLRKLLLDGDALMHQVNRLNKSKICFHVNYRAIPRLADMVFWSIADGIDPETSPPPLRNPRDVGKDDFLSTRVLFIRGQHFTIKDIIRHVANYEGAVHASTPTEGRHAELIKAAQEFFLGGLPATLQLLRAIGRVVAKGLAPLESELIKKIGE